MRGYADITRSTSACVHFVDANEVHEEDRDLITHARASGTMFVYVDCVAFLDRPWEIPSAIGTLAKTNHPPYHDGDKVRWVRWLDDLISLAHTSPGLVIILDNADQLFARHRKLATEMIEAYLIQFHHWLERNKPCHLCFQMSSTPLLRSWFMTRAEA